MALAVNGPPFPVKPEVAPMHPTCHPTPPIDFLSFTDAIGLCHQVAANAPLRGSCFGAVIADAGHRVVDRTLFEGDVLGPGFVLGWVAGFRHGHGATNAVIISVVSEPVDMVDPFRLLDYERHRCLLDFADVALLDWLIHDGFSIRSMAYTVHPQVAWLDDPPDRRAERLSRTDPGLVHPEVHHVA